MAKFPSGLLAWFTLNPVSANLLMVLIWLGGASSLFTMEKDVFPRFSPPRFEILAPYPGATPSEVEESVCIPIEEAIYSSPGIKHLHAQAAQGECWIKAEVLPDYDRQMVMNAARGRIQAIPHLPKALEKIEVKEAQHESDDGVIWVALHGQATPLDLERYGERIQQDLASIPGVIRAFNYGFRRYEITIQVSQAKLLQHHLSLHEVAEAVRLASLDLAGGALKTPAGDLLLRAKGKADRGEAVGELVLRTGPDGSRLRVKDVAVVKDGLEEHDWEWRHNGEPAQGWEIHADRDSVAVARRVKAYVANMAPQLPHGLTLKAWWDDSEAFDERTRTLLEDGFSGFLLVYLVLYLFLDGRVALWAALGILTSVLGALWWMPALGVSLNMLSLFGFLLAMGILVDDAIIIGESIHTQQSRDETGGMARRSPPLAAVVGARAVALPVVLAVLVALVAFLPGLFLPGWTGQMMRPICLVMILTLMFSLVEALLILPAHLAAGQPPAAAENRVMRLRSALNSHLERFVMGVYAPFLRRALAWPWLTLAVFACLLIISSALVIGGHVRHSIQPDVSKDTFWAHVSFPPGAPLSETHAVTQRVEQALFRLRNEVDRELGTHLMGGVETMVFENEGNLWLELTPEARQRLPAEDFVRRWRTEISDLGRARIDFIYREGDVPYDIDVSLGSADPSTVLATAEALKKKLASYPGVFDVVDSNQPGNPEIRLRLRPEAERLGLRLKDLAEQVRQGYFGEEAQRLQRGRNEVRVMVRYPLEERLSLDHLRAMPVQLPDGSQAPLDSLAELGLAPGFDKLTREDRRRVLKVQARVDPSKADINAIYANLEENYLPGLQRQFPTLRVSMGQERQEQESAQKELARNTLIALTIIYALIAVPFRSYLKPLIFLLAAPVAWSGAVLAHWLAGLTLSMESLVGMIAASGVVINDSLVLLDYIRERDETGDMAGLVAEACVARFRPILLAFLTNFAGFLPTLLETSEQAQFLIPMTLALAAGLLVGMSASLVLTPVAYAALASRGQ